MYQYVRAERRDVLYRNVQSVGHLWKAGAADGRLRIFSTQNLRGDEDVIFIYKALLDETPVEFFATFEQYRVYAHLPETSEHVADVSMPIL